MPERALAPPDFLIIGAGKCGTSSLAHYLRLHPQISMAWPKETNFFARDASNAELEAYLRSLGAGRMRGEASPSYTMHPRIAGVPERIKAVAPAARLIYLVGDPVERTLRAWREGVSSEGETRSLLAAMSDMDPRTNNYVCGSRYATQLARYLEHFPRDRVLVLDQDDLRHRRSATLQTVFAFLGVDAGFTAQGFEEELHTRSDQRRWHPAAAALRNTRVVEHWRRLPPSLRRPIVRPVRAVLSQPVPDATVDAVLRDRLRDHLAGEVARLRELTGLTFASWSL